MTEVEDVSKKSVAHLVKTVKIVQKAGLYFSQEQKDSQDKLSFG